VANDGHLDEAGLRPKLDAGEIVVAEVDGERVGLLRLDHSGRQCRSWRWCGGGAGTV
jgi:hypothetical protein